VGLGGIGCAAHRQPNPQASPTSTTEPGTDLPAYRLTVSGQAAQGTAVAAAPSPTVGLPAFLTDPGAAVSVTLHGGAQPPTPVRLSFSFAGKTPPRSDHDVTRAVAAVAEGSTEPEILPSR
jgi:hypothetical protein